MLCTTKRFQLLIVCLIAGLSCHNALSATQMVILEDAKETSTADVSLPSSDAGTLYFKNCVPCNQNSIHLGSTSKFLIGDTAVDFAVFKKTAEERNRFLMVFYDPKTHVVTRMKL